jgi:hypothetical protein
VFARLHLAASPNPESGKPFEQLDWERGMESLAAPAERPERTKATREAQAASQKMVQRMSSAKMA